MVVQPPDDWVNQQELGDKKKTKHQYSKTVTSVQRQILMSQLPAVIMADPWGLGLPWSSAESESKKPRHPAVRGG